jgi:hypothetical protein
MPSRMGEMWTQFPPSMRADLANFKSKYMPLLQKGLGVRIKNGRLNASRCTSWKDITNTWIHPTRGLKVPATQENI